jgi:hypothetical protein
MAVQAAAFDLSTSFLDLPKTLAYGLVRGAGNLFLQQALSDNTRIAFYELGEGPWDSMVRLWVNDKLVALPSLTTVHFHPGGDGEIGNGLVANSTGGDQHVDQFFTLIPGGLDPITFSRHAWLALKVAPDPGAPSATLTVLADYQAMQVRQFDAGGNQTAFAWTQNWAWIICDFLIRKFVLREGKINQPLVAAELARFDWASFSAAATYYDAVLGAGQKRFSDGGVVYLNDTNTADRALEQMLLMCRSYLLERNGKLSLYADQPRASGFTFTSDNVAPLKSSIMPSQSVSSSSGGALTFKGSKSNLRSATNRLLPTYRDLNIATGSADDATRFAVTSSPQLNHEAHQRAVGARGPGLSVLPKVTELALDLGVNTPERVWRILKGMLVRQLGDDVDSNTAYNAPFTTDWTGYEDSLAVEPGDVVTIDKSLSEEFGGKLVEVLQVEEVPDGTRNFTALEYMPNAFPDVAPVQQPLKAPTPSNPIPLPPTGLVVSTVEIVRVADGIKTSFIGITWTSPADLSVLNGGHIIVQYKKHADSLWLDIGKQDGNVTKAQVGPVIDGTQYDIQMWAQNHAGVNSSIVTASATPTGTSVTLDTIADGAVWTRTPVMIGSAITIENGNFKASASILPPPGWIEAGAVSAYDTVTYFRAPQSVKVSSSVSGGGITSLRKYAVRPGDVVRISGMIRMNFGTGPAYIGAAFYDGSGTLLSFFTATSSSTSWTFVSRSAIAPAGTVYALVSCGGSGAPTVVCFFDEIHFARMYTAFELTPINTSGRATAPAGALSQSGTTKTINVASVTVQFGDGQITYNSGSVTPGAYGTYFVYADDPGYAGGAVTYVATLTESDVYANNGRIYFGLITTAAGGGGASTNAPGAGGGRNRTQ